MAERQTYKLNKAVQAVPVQGSQDVWNQVSSTIGTFYDQYVAGETDLLQSQGAQAGLVAATGEEKKKIQMLNAGTVYGQAFNDAAVKAYGAAIELDVQTTINEYANDKNNIENRDNFNAAVLQYSDDFVSGIPNPTFKAIALQKIKEVTGPYEREIYKKQKEKDFLKSLVTIDKKFDASVDTAAIAGREAVQKWYAGYKDFIGREEFEGGVTIEEYVDTFGKDMYQHFQKIDADLTDMLNVPGNHFDDGAIKARKENAILEIYQSVLMAEYVQAEKEGRGIGFKEEFKDNPIKYIKSQPHLNVIFNETILTEYPMTVTGTEDDPSMSDRIYDAMNKDWDRRQAVIEFKEEQEEEELEGVQSDNFIESLSSIVSGDGTVTSDTLSKQMDDNGYSNDDYKFLTSAIKLGKYKVDDADSKIEMTNYLLTTNDSVKKKVARIKEFYNDNLLSGDTTVKMLTDATDGTFNDVTSSPSFKRAAASIKPFFQKEKGVAGMFAIGDEKVYMEEALNELYIRTAAGENALEIYSEIKDKYIKIMADNEPATFIRDETIVDGRAVRTINCEKSLSAVNQKYKLSANVAVYEESLERLSRTCPIQ